LDEAIVHHILQWHTLYWSESEPLGILSEGLFHLLTLALLVWGGARLWQPSADLHGRRGPLIAAILIGAGEFNLNYRVVQHVLLHLHLVNEYVCATPTKNNSLASCPADAPYEVA
jgi:uncharacterized membrane protein